MLAWCIRFIILRLVHLFYPHIEVQGRAQLPTSGPVLFVLNHPNGLLDPLLLMASLDRRVAFLAKSTFFANPVGRLCMNAFGALPVFRQQDKKHTGGASRDATDRNEATFARCRALLQQGTALALFPEGTTHSGSTLLPLRTGAARIALSAEAENEWQLGLQVVPVGLWYQHKTLFRSPALLMIGQPFTLAAYSAQYTDAPRDAVHDLTEQIDASLDTVVLQAEHAELLMGMPVIAAWTAPDGPPPTLAQRHARAATLLNAYQRLVQSDPERMRQLTQQARRFARTLRTLGITDPWALELSRAYKWRLTMLMIGLMLTFPVAILGFALSYGPYRLAGVITPPLVGRHDTLLGTGKLISGSALVLLGWVIAAIAAGWIFGTFAGFVVLAVAPVLAYCALRWGEGWRAFREALTYAWVRKQHRTLTQAIIERRQQLAAEVIAAMNDAARIDNVEQSTTLQS